MLVNFKNFSIERMQVDEMIAMIVFGEQLRAQYEKLNLEEPDYLDTNLKVLKREVESRTLEQKEARKKQIRLQLDGLETPTQKKARLQKELADLEKQTA